MVNIIRGIVVCIWIVAETIIICKRLENTNLKRQITILSVLLIAWNAIRIIKYNISGNDELEKFLWYLFYFPILFSSTQFLNIGTFHNKNKKHVKIIKTISVIGSGILFLFVLTNDWHQLIFKIDMQKENWSGAYTYGFVYYILFLWVTVNIFYGILSGVKYSRGLYKKQKFALFSVIFLIAIFYAVGYMEKISFVWDHIFDFTLIYCMCYMLALIIIVYKEKYRISLEETVYKEIEEAIKSKTVLINQIIYSLPSAKDKNKSLKIIKLLVAYCKRESNLVVVQKEKSFYTSDELKLFMEEAIQDASVLGIIAAVNMINRFEVPIYIVTVIHEYLYNLFEYAQKYKTTNIFISLEMTSGFLYINTMVETEENIYPFEYNPAMWELKNSEKITTKQSVEENMLHIKVTIPMFLVVPEEIKLTEKEAHKLLEVKSKVHDILGQRLSLISKIVEKEDIKESEIEEIKPLLNNILNDLDNDMIVLPQEMLRQIINTCELAGTKVYIVGKLPSNYMKAITLVKIIRECCTNAIRHAKAMNVYISIKESEKIEMEIKNDGDIIEAFCEGDGIKGMRNRVNEWGGTLEIVAKDNFNVKVTI